MGNESDDLVYLKVAAALDKICTRVDETLRKQKQHIEACKKKNELESKVAAELKLHNELEERLQAITGRAKFLEGVCAELDQKLIIADSDRTRLNNAKELYQIGKELTGIRWDFTAPSNVAKGYVKSESRKLLEPFEVKIEDGCGAGCEPVWAVLAGGVGGWPALVTATTVRDKENTAPN